MEFFAEDNLGLSALPESRQLAERPQLLAPLESYGHHGGIRSESCSAAAGLEFFDLAVTGTATLREDDDAAIVFEHADHHVERRLPNGRNVPEHPHDHVNYWDRPELLHGNCG